MPKLQATIVFSKNWAAIHEPCPTCDGSGLIENISCSWCGDGETKNVAGSGKKYRYIINRGSSRSSKTISLIDCYDLYARSEPNKRLTVWRDTRVDCKKTVLRDAVKHLRLTGRYGVNQNLNKTDSIFHYDNHSSFEIHGTDDEETVHGLEQDGAWFNEPYKISRDTFDQVDMRTSDFVLIDYNPKKGHWVEDLMKDPRAIIIDSTFQDNPFCPPEQRKKILSYQPVSMCHLVESGELETPDAMAYDMDENDEEFSAKHVKELRRCRENEHKNSASAFKWAVYGLGTKAERPNRIFNWNEISPEEYQAIEAKTYIGSDWGKVDPWGIAEIKYYDGGLYVHELNYDSENQIREKMNSTEMSQISSEDEGIVSWKFSQLGISKNTEIVADNNRPMKIMMLRRKGWTAYAANKPKGSIIDGIDLLDNLTVYYTSTSKNLKHEQENYSRKIDRHGSVLEEPEDKDNHIMDLIRYVALHLQRNQIIRLV